jgi:hypothetical protein
MGAAPRVVIDTGDENKIHPIIYLINDTPVIDEYAIHKQFIELGRISTCNECHNPPVERGVLYWHHYYKIKFKYSEN